MRAGLNRELVRGRTAYRLGRSVADGFLIGELLLAVLAVVGVCVYETRLEGVQLVPLAGVLCGAVVLSAAAVLKRELVHAVFDLADRALDGAAQASANPFH